MGQKRSKRNGGSKSAARSGADLQAADAMERKNVVFIVMDDLRADTEDIITPHLDKFKSESVDFSQAHANVALCGPSRASFLSGRRPENTGYFSHSQKLDERTVHRGALTLPEWFTMQDYQAWGVSKIFHDKRASEMTFTKDFYEYVKASVDGGCGSRMSCSAPEQTENASAENFVDLYTADWAIPKIRELAAKDPSEENWILAVGIRKPHMPYRVPQRILDLYEGSDGLGPALPEPLERFQRSSGQPEAAHSVCGNLLSVEEVFQADVDGARTRLSDDSIRYIRKSYFTAVTWADEILGKVLDEIETAGLSNSTIVSVVSDHGFSLGEHMAYCKRSSFDVTTKVPLAIRVPGVEPRNDTNPFTLVDLFPTIADLAGVPLGREEYLADMPIDGVSQAHRVVKQSPKLHVNESSHEAPPKVEEPEDIASTMTPVCLNDEGLRSECSIANYQMMGFSIRTNRFRYTEWRAWDLDNSLADWKLDAAPNQVELYDMLNDPFQTKNEANTEKYASVQENLKWTLRARYSQCNDNLEEAACNANAQCSWAGATCNDLDACLSFETENECPSVRCRWTSGLCLTQKFATTVHKEGPPKTSSPTSAPSISSVSTREPSMSPVTSTMAPSKPTSTETAIPTQQPSKALDPSVSTGEPSVSPVASTMAPAVTDTVAPTQQQTTASAEPTVAKSTEMPTAHTNRTPVVDSDTSTSEPSSFSSGPSVAPTLSGNFSRDPVVDDEKGRNSAANQNCWRSAIFVVLTILALSPGNAV